MQRTNQLLQLRARLDARAKEKWEAMEAELRDQATADAPFDPVATLVCAEQCGTCEIC